MSEYGERESYKVGYRVEFHPAMDIWMRGARFGTVTSVKRRNGQADIYYVKPDSAPSIRIKATADNLRSIT